MAGFLNPNGNANGEERPFDVENSNPEPGKVPGGARRRKCNLPLLLSLLAALISCLALIFGIYGVVAARKLISRSQDHGVVLSSSPQKGAAATGSLFAGTGYFARLLPGMMYSRSDHKTLPVGSIVYLLGGLTNARQLAANASAAAESAGELPQPLVLNSTVAYDTYTGAWTSMADMPQPRFRHCGTVLNDRLFVIGGMAAWEAADASQHVVSDRVMSFDPASNTWSLLPGRLNHPRADCCAAAAGGKIFVAGGWTTDYSNTLGSVEVFDPAAGTWTLLPNNLTLPRGDCEAVSLSDRYLVVLGGVTPDGSFTSSVEALDASAPGQPWSTRPNMTTARGDFAAEALPGGRIIVMGGETTNGSATEFAIHSVEECVAADNIWIPKAPLPEARFRFDTAHVGERVYVFGGAPTCSSVLTGDGRKPACVQVALNSTWGYFDVRYPRIYYSVDRQ